MSELSFGIIKPEEAGEQYTDLPGLEFYFDREFVGKYICVHHRRYASVAIMLRHGRVCFFSCGLKSTQHAMGYLRTSTNRKKEKYIDQKK